MTSSRNGGCGLGLRAALGLALALAVAGGVRVHAQGQELPGDRVAEIHEACSAAGIPVESVRFNEGKYEVVMRAGADGRRAEAEAVMGQVLAKAKAVIVVDNVADALVVLRFEPNNASANAVVRARYEQLKKGPAPR